MTSLDIVTLLGNISHSLYPVQRLVSGAAYIFGILFFITAISKFRKIADQRAQSSNHGGVFSSLMYLLFGALLLYLPSALEVASNTAFGVGNVLTYQYHNPYDIYSTIGLFVRTAGVIWFIRGCVLIVQASEPGVKHGPKALVFIFAGILSINFDSTVSVLNNTMGRIANWSVAIKNSQGY